MLLSATLLCECESKYCNGGEAKKNTDDGGINIKKRQIVLVNSDIATRVESCVFNVRKNADISCLQAGNYYICIFWNL